MSLQARIDGVTPQNGSLLVDVTYTDDVTGWTEAAALSIPATATRGDVQVAIREHGYQLVEARSTEAYLRARIGQTITLPEPPAR